MPPTASRHLSPWVDTMAAPRTSRDPAAAERADVLVLGAGIVGLTTALLLQRRGREVAVLEARGLGSSVTTHSTVAPDSPSPALRPSERMGSSSTTRMRMRVSVGCLAPSGPGLSLA